MTNLDGVAGKRVSDADLVAAYKQTGNVHKAGELIGLTGGTVHERLVRLGLNVSVNVLTTDDEERLRREYVLFRDAGKLDELARLMGRNKTFLCTRAKAMGLTNKNCARPWTAKWKYMSEEAARVLFEQFKESKLGLRRYCKKRGLDDLGFSRTMQGFFPDEWDAVIESKAPRQTHYCIGRAFEYRTRDDLRSRGYFVLRSPRSGSPIDLVAIRKGEVLFVQCKIGGSLPPAEWNEFYQLCLSVGALPLLSESPGLRGVAYWLLTGEKDGTRKAQPMEPWTWS